MNLKDVLVQSKQLIYLKNYEHSTGTLAMTLLKTMER